MKISELLESKKRTLSFEVFPPKTTEGYEGIFQKAKEIAGLSPDFMSVTYGAGGGTSAFTAGLAHDLMQETGVPVIAHLTCVSSTKETVKETIRVYKEKGIENIMALRGDIPEGGRLPNEYAHASELIAELKDEGDFCIGGACYPEGHIESPSKETDLWYLKKKVDAGVDFLTTQMFFDNNIFYNFLYRAREAGILCPILPGIMPITARKQLGRSVAMSGTMVPPRFSAIVDCFGDDPKAMEQAGIVYAADQIIDLFANGITHVHVYSMNKPSVALGILQNLRGILGEKQVDYESKFD